MNRAFNSSYLVVLLCLLSSCSFIEGYQDGYRKANEGYLRSDLSKMREAIKKYTNDKKTPPQSLDDLVHSEYLSMIPKDPFTDKADWTPEYYDCSSKPDCLTGIKDVHSSSSAKSSNGKPYNTW